MDPRSRVLHRLFETCSVKICEPFKLQQTCIWKQQEDEKHEDAENEEAEDVPEEKMQQEEEATESEEDEMSED